jgi:hypothetical protein
MTTRNRRALRPSLERIEPRRLLTATLAFRAAQSNAQASAAIDSVILSQLDHQGAAAVNPVGSSSPLIGQGTPTPREQGREAFRAVFSGPLSTSPGRFSDQAETLYIRGIGGSNFFLHGNFNMGIVIPADPGKPTFGFATLSDKNANSGGIMGLQLSAVPGAVDSRGRPTRLTFTEDPNIYSGIFFVNTSRGTVTIKYGQGAATVVFQGSVYTSGLTNPLRNADLQSRGGRLSPRSGRP